MNSVIHNGLGLQPFNAIALHKLNLTNATKKPVIEFLRLCGISQKQLIPTKNNTSKYYSNTFRGNTGILEGIILHSRDTKGKDTGRYLIEINGSTLENKPLEKQLVIVKIAIHYGFTASTVHIKLRDTNYREHGYCIDSISELIGLNDSKESEYTCIQNVKGFRKGRVWTSSDGSKPTSLNIGSCTSNAYVHVYYALANHGVDAIDWEFRVKGSECTELMNKVVDKGVSVLYYYMVKLLQFTEDVKDSTVSKFWENIRQLN